LKHYVKLITMPPVKS